MSNQDKKALHQSSLQQLQQQLGELQKELVQTRLSFYANKLEDVSKLYRLRKKIARIKTVITLKNKAADKVSDDATSQEVAK